MASLDYHAVREVVKDEMWAREMTASLDETYRKLCEIEKGNAERVERVRNRQKPTADPLLLLFALLLLYLLLLVA